MITHSTRRESLHKLNSARMYKHVLKALDDGKKTAKEVAQVLHDLGAIPYPVRQAVAPRLTELTAAGRVKITGKAYDRETERHVAVYEKVKDEKHNTI